MHLGLWRFCPVARRALSAQHVQASAGTALHTRQPQPTLPVLTGPRGPARRRWAWQGRRGPARPGEALLVRPGAILSRSELEDRLYGWGNEVESNAVEFLIHGLRRKLGKDVIGNVRGLGWMVSKGD